MRHPPHRRPMYLRRSHRRLRLTLKRRRVGQKPSESAMTSTRPTKLPSERQGKRSEILWPRADPETDPFQLRLPRPQHRPPHPATTFLLPLQPIMALPLPLPPLLRKRPPNHLTAHCPRRRAPASSRPTNRRTPIVQPILWFGSIPAPASIISRGPTTTDTPNKEPTCARPTRRGRVIAPR